MRLDAAYLHASPHVECRFSSCHVAVIIFGSVPEFAIQQYCYCSWTCFLLACCKHWLCKVRLSTAGSRAGLHLLIACSDSNRVLMQAEQQLRTWSLPLLQSASASSPQHACPIGLTSLSVPGFRRGHPPCPYSTGWLPGVAAAVAAGRPSMAMRTVGGVWCVAV